MALGDMGRMISNVPIPGQGLTQNPHNKLPTERPPQHTSPAETIEYIFDDLTSPKKLPALTRLLKKRSMFIDAVAAAYIEQGLIEGKWNTDMAHLLVEPTIFTLMWVASQVGAPVKFKTRPSFNSGGTDVLEVSREEETQEAVQSLLSPEGE